MSRLTVLAGPTAVGKGTVAASIRERYADVWLSISATTRKPRPTEKDGEHYYFLSEEKFDSIIESGGFLEWAVVHGKYRYGTLKSHVIEALSANKKALLEIDLQGARKVRENMPEARLVFLAPPNWEELVKRLSCRGTEDFEERERRLVTAKLELDAINEFDYVIVNDDVVIAADKLVSFMGVDTSA